MKKVLVLLLILGFSCFIVFVYIRNNRSNQTPILLSPLKNTSIKGSKTQNLIKFLFVPYWSLDGRIDSGDYNGFIYFGITPDNKGIKKDDAGYTNISKFTDLTNKETDKFLTVRVLNQDSASQILRDKKLQKNIFEESILEAKNNFFNGLILDFEMQGIPFETFTKSISDFYSEFYDYSHKNKLSFYITLYGDTFYRLRPYDVKTLAQDSDEVLIMAYDFHKAGGDPGPNFPLSGKEVYGYDFKAMIDDFLKIVPKEKISVIFGLFGYDWKIDDKGRSKEQAQVLTLSQIKNKFLSVCEFDNCLIKRDETSSEMKITYTDKEKNKHVIWFEDMESVLAKQKYLKNAGINSFGFWAYSYF